MAAEVAAVATVAVMDIPTGKFIAQHKHFIPSFHLVDIPRLDILVGDYQSFSCFSLQA